MPTGMQVTALPTMVPGLTAGQRYIVVNQEGTVVRLHEGTDAPSPDTRDFYPIPGRSADQVSAARVRLEAGDNLYAYAPSGDGWIAFGEEP